LMPQLRDNISFVKNDHINPQAAKDLFSIWRTAENKINNKVYKRPINISLTSMERLEQEGLAKLVGDKIEITSKGEKVIKIMILGDNRSSFDNEDFIIDYHQALSNTKDVKTAKKLK